MAYHITDNCIQCGECALVCDEGAITDGHIDTDLCIGCGCCVAICPADAIEHIGEARYAH